MQTSVLAIGYQHNWWEILTSPFMRNALLGGTLVALAAATRSNTSPPPARCSASAAPW